MPSDLSSPVSPDNRGILGIQEVFGPAILSLGKYRFMFQHPNFVWCEFGPSASESLHGFPYGEIRLATEGAYDHMAMRMRGLELRSRYKLSSCSLDVAVKVMEMARY